MIRKVFRVDGPLALVRDVVGDSDAWPQWDPGVRSCRILTEEAERRRIAVGLSVLGSSSTQIRDFWWVGNTLKQRQVSGWFKRWETEWSLLEPPDRSGTTVTLQVDWDLGMRALITPPWMIQRMSIRAVDESIAGLRGRVRERLAEERPAVVAGESLLRLYETPDGLEVWLAGRTYVLRLGE